MEKQKRLQSLKLPRDLTLGGTKPKKAFTPNLNAARNKERSKEIFIKNEDKRKANNKKDFRNNKKNNDNTERFVQSSGIFSDGMGTDVLRKTHYERTYSSKDDTHSSAAIPIPKVKADDWQLDDKNESKVYDDIMGCEPSINEYENLPFAPVSWNENDFKEEKKVPTVKPEVTKVLEIDRLKIETVVAPKEFQEADNFSDYNPGLTLWKMPDSFAGKGLSDNPDVQTFFDYKLNEMVEGQIGKMKIRQSGKIDVFLGCVKYQIESSELETVLEKVVAIDTRDPDKTSIVLGQVQSRFILNPDWNDLLKDS